MVKPDTLLIPNLAIKFFLCDMIVARVTLSWLAISLLILPLTMSSNTCNSRLCSVCGEEVFASIPKLDVPAIPEKEESKIDVAMIIAGVSIPVSLLLVGTIILLLIKYKKH